MSTRLTSRQGTLVAPGAAARSRALATLAAARYTAIGIQLLAVVFLIRAYQLESRTFFHVAILAVAGFAVHAVLPRVYRLPFFAGLSVAGVLLVFGWAGGATLLATGLVLIGACHLPIRWGWRVAVLALLGAVLALGRSNILPLGWDAAVWPILGSMFMFRLALYLHAIRQDGFRFNGFRTLAYFFMLPNVVFPLYPVVDYGAFERNHYDRDALEIYETGVRWIVRGLLQLVLYRVVYQFVLTDAAALVDLTDLIRFLLGTFLLYLRVSGSFHLIVGLLYLFGFRLPETHHLYFLASGFTDFWRRINIYWKDFMMKLVYYPSFFRLRKWGTERALVAATVVVFLATWLLHSYQWFWLRGGFPLTAQDLLFWGLLGALVVRASLKEVRKPRNRTLGTRRWSAKLAFRTVGTFLFLCVLWSLWSSESVIEWLWMWRAAANAGAADVGLLAALLTAGVLVGGRSWGAPGAGNGAGNGASGVVARILHPGVRAAATLVLLLGLAQTPVYDEAAPRLAGVVGSVKTAGLNVQDAELQHRGYYEKLDNPGRMSATLWATLSRKPADWAGSREAGILRDRDDFLGWELVPSASSEWNGIPVTTNRWGMRDRDYSLDPPPDAHRIAFLGQSHIMGTYVTDDEVFDNVLEDRLNAGSSTGVYELLNFGVTDYSLTQQYGLLESRVLAFSPNVVVLTVAANGRARVVRHLLRVAYSGGDLPHPELRHRLERLGLRGLSDEGVPLPFEWPRALARRLGISARMPYNEALARARLSADSLNAWAVRESVRRIREAGAVPALLALPTVGQHPGPLPEMAVAAEAGAVVLDLRDVYEPDPRRFRVAEWDTHPNAEAHRVIAERLYHELRSTGLLGPGTLPTATH